MLEKVVWGNTVESWGISIIIIVVAIILLKLIALINRKLLRPAAQKTKNKLDDVVVDSLESPILFGIMLLGIWIAIHRLTFPENFIKTVYSAYRILVVLNITWFFARMFSGMLDVYWVDRAHEKHASVKMVPIVRRTILVLIWIVGIVMALSNVGVNISALLGTLGIGGVAFALASQDTIKNIFGAFTILTDKPFSIGDVINVDGFEGTIEDIGIRSTRLRGYDKRIVTFPNYKIADAYVTNISSEPMRRVVVNLGLTYDTKPEGMKQAMELLQAIPTKVSDVSSDGLVANFTQFADSALIINFVYFIVKGADVNGTISKVNMQVLTDFTNVGLNFAFPSQTVYVEKGD